MLEKFKKFCFLVILLVIVFIFPNTALTKQDWMKSLKKFIPPGRVKFVQEEVRLAKQISRSAVHMQHSTFFLNRTYLPRLEKNEGHILLQLSQSLNPAIEMKLQQHGVRLLEYIPSNTWKAKVPAAALLKIKAFDFVEAMGGIHPVDKFPKHVLEKGFYPYSHNNDGTVSVLVTFHKDVPFNRVLQILTELSGTTRQDGFIIGLRVLLRIPQERLQDLADFDEVNWIEDRPAPHMNYNIDAAALSNTDDLQRAPYNLDGSGIRIGMWDGGVVQSDHPDLSGRVIVIDTSSVDEHATHVAGTMIGSGSYNPEAKGMAPAATLYSYDFTCTDELFDDVLPEMIDAVDDYHIELSNHSYGPAIGWEPYGNDGEWVWWGNADDFGLYTSDSRSWDQTVEDKGLIIIKSAGNDREDKNSQDGVRHYHANLQGCDEQYTPDHEDSHPSDGEYDCIDPIASAKNIITVGAVDGSGYMSPFSSWGPAEDGRVKPDVVANGVNLTSTCLEDSYCEKNGTSMSTPVVTGAVALVFQRYAEVFGTKPSPAMVRALLINTASDLGNRGPDYSYGWGLLDDRAAVDLIDAGGVYFPTDLVSDGEILEYPITVSYPTQGLKVTVAWTDPAGSPSAEYALVNDIDLELIDPAGGTHMPWTLDRSSPSAAAGRGINLVDNVEQVLVNFPQKGVWTVRIKGMSIQGIQPFAMVSSLLDEFQVNTDSFGVQTKPSVAALSGGGFVVAWADAWQEGPARGYGIYGQLFDDLGSPVGGEFHVNTYTDDDQQGPSVAGLSGGGFVATWLSEGQDGSGNGIYGQQFDSAGDKVGGEFQVNTYTDDDQQGPSVAGLSGGGLVVTWQSYGQDGNYEGVYGQLFDGAGSPVGGEFPVNTTTDYGQNLPSVAPLSNGGFVVAWVSRGGIYCQRFDSAANKVEGEFKASTYQSCNSPSVAGLSGGGFVVTWHSWGQDGSGFGIYGQLFDGTGSPVGGEFQVNTYTDDAQDNPAVAALSGGGFVVTWESMDQDGNHEGVYGQIYDSARNAVGGEFQVNTFIASSQDSPSVARLSGGDYVVAWSSASQDGSSDGIYGRIFEIHEPDSDGDDLPDYLENSACTNPFDADTDDDGLSDGEEDANKNGVTDPGETNPCNRDTDGDLIQDGTETGITEPVPDPDDAGPLLGTDTGVFQPDLDQNTTSDPLDRDTDGDGFSDGREDLNRNGSIDPGESDPNDSGSKPALRAMPWIPLLLGD